jgi:hypothetical protein
LSLSGRFDQIVAAARPKLAKVFNTWLHQELPQDVFSVVELSGFGLEDPLAQPLQWDLGFETTGKKWLAITIPFRGDRAQEAVVDT